MHSSHDAATPHLAEATERLLALLQKALGHELPNHLLAVQGLARIVDMDESDRLSPEGKELLRRLAAAALRAHELTKALADLVRTARTPLPDGVCSLGLAAREALVSVKQAFPGRGLALMLPEKDVSLPVPGAALRQVIAGLLRTALTAAPPTADLHISADVREEAGWFAVIVSSDGPALSAAEQRRLMEPFSSREAGTSGGELGLFPVQQLVETWGGFLEVSAPVERGLIFRFTLPPRKG